MQLQDNQNFEALHGRKMLYHHEQNANKRSERRRKTKEKKRLRMDNAQKRIYSFPCGWIIIKDKLIKKKENQIIPEHAEPIISPVRICTKYFDPETQTYCYINKIVHLKTGMKHVPEKTVKRTVCRDYVPIKPRLKKINSGKKQYRKMFSRKIRHAKNLDKSWGKAGYKRIGDLMWALW